MLVTTGLPLLCLVSTEKQVTTKIAHNRNSPQVYRASEYTIATVNRIEELIQAADRCVLCALCSNHCPTYQHYREEGESPRGRIMLSAALLKGNLTPSPAMIDHLRHCLLCRACEQACPSEVPYSELLDETYAQLPDIQGRAKWLERLAAYPQWIPRLHQAAGWWKQLKLPLPSVGHAALEQSLPSQPLHSHYPAQGKQQGRVGLFTGCFTRSFDNETLQSAITLLTALGYEVIVPTQQQCCGAIAQHHGNTARSQQQVEQNRTHFNAQPLDAVLFTSSGCGSQLTEHGNLDAPCMEVSHFILQAPQLSALSFEPLPHKVILHHPCSLTNVLNGERSVEQLLEQVPALEWEPLGPNQQCCGAAGTHHLREPATAVALRQPKIDALEASNATTLLTTNYGCALHLTEGTLNLSQKITILHPITLLAQQLITP